MQSITKDVSYNGAHNSEELDLTAPFEVGRYFTVLRSIGQNPITFRQTNGSISLSRDWRAMSEPKQALLAKAMEWAVRQDPDGKKQAAFCRRALATSPSNEIVLLG